MQPGNTGTEGDFGYDNALARPNLGNNNVYNYAITATGEDLSSPPPAPTPSTATPTTDSC